MGRKLLFTIFALMMWTFFECPAVLSQDVDVDDDFDDGVVTEVA